MILDENIIDRCITWSFVPMLAGVVCWLAGLHTTGMMLVCCGAMGGSFTEYRTERGLWMLGALFLVLFGALYGTFVFFSVADVLAGRGLVGMLAIDAFVATATLGFMVRFLWSVIFLNRQLASVPTRTSRATDNHLVHLRTQKRLS